MKHAKKLILSLFLTLSICSLSIAADYRQIDFLLTSYLHPTTGVVLSGGKVKTFLSGTSTLSALKTDSNGVGTAANPFTLDSSGKSEVYGNQIYKFEIYDSDDVLLETIEGLEYKTNESFVSDDAYDKTTWNGVTAVAPTKNAVRDQFQVMLESFTAEGPVDSNSHQIQESIGANVASASALAILTDGNYYVVTGTNNIDTINTSGKVGTQIELEFSGILTINHDATNLINITGANIATADGDIAKFREYASGDWIMTGYEKADGAALVVSEYKIGKFTRDLTTASGDVAYTGVGFQPSSIDFVSQATETASWGYDDGSDPETIFAEPAATTYNTNATSSIFIRTSGANQQSGSIKTFDSDGFTITWVKSNTPTGTMTVLYRAYK